MRVVSKYEVACRRCGVSYPPGQKQCIHCGGRTEKSIVEMPDSSAEFASAVGKVEREADPEPVLVDGGREIVFLPRGEGGDEAEERPGGTLRRLGGLVWVVLFVILTVIRMCSED